MTPTALATYAKYALCVKHSLQKGDKKNKMVVNAVRAKYAQSCMVSEDNASKIFSMTQWNDNVCTTCSLQIKHQMEEGAEAKS